MMDAKKSGEGHTMYKLCRKIIGENPVVERDTYCLKVEGGKLVGEGPTNAAGEREGLGTMVYASGNMYVGQWRAGVKEGQGTYYYATGDRYEGGYKADNREGQGTYYSAIGDR